MSDQTVGDDDGRFIHTIGHNSVQGWVSQNKDLVTQLQGNPKQMLLVFPQQVFPWFVDDADAIEE